MSAACTKFAEDTIPTYDNPVKPTVTAKAVSDSSITVTITAGPNTNYFGYAVMVGAPGRFRIFKCEQLTIFIFLFSVSFII